METTRKSDKIRSLHILQATHEERGHS